MKRFSFKRVIAHVLTIVVIASSLFSGGAYAGETEHSHVEQDFSEEYDTPVNVIEDKREKTEEVDKNEVNLEEVEVVEEQLEEVVEAENEKKVTVAVIDTGLDLNNAILKERLAEGYTPNMTDENGHGTLMAEIICSQTSENVKILPMKAFDENGNSTVGQVYDAIMSACESDVDVINLSVSGAGTSKMLTAAIDTAKAKGITVVVAAGNNASDVAGFMPGNIENALTVSATDENEAFAEYSNYGDLVDFAATGTIIKDKGTEDCSDDEIFQGTSVASAYVTGYVAYLLDNNENADIQRNLIASAEDRGDAGKDYYYGNGYLSLDKLSYAINTDGSLFEDEETEEPEEKVDEETTEETTEETATEEAEEELAVQAEPYEVNNEQQLRNAINSCSSGGMIHINKDIKISQYIRIIGSRRNIVIEGNGNSIYTENNIKCLFAIDSENITIKNTIFDFNHRKCNGACIIRGGTGTVTFEDCTFKNVDYIGTGPNTTAGVVIDQKNNIASTTSIKNCTFSDIDGVSISLHIGSGANKTINVESCYIKSGEAFDSSGITIDNNKNNINLNITNTEIIDSKNNGICNYNPNASVNITACNIHSNNNGVSNAGKATITNNSIYSNRSGISNSGTVNFSNGDIYSNTNYGVQNAGNFNMSGGSIYSNTIGLYNNGGTSTMTAGEIKNSNQMNVDVYNGTVTFRGGKITGSGQYGVQIENAGSSTFNQYADIDTNTLGGTRVIAQGINRYNVYNGATSAEGSSKTGIGVYLEPGASMTIHQPLTRDVKVASYDRYTGKVIANCDSEAIARSAQQYLKLTTNNAYRTTELNTIKYRDTYHLQNYGYNHERLWNHYNANNKNKEKAKEDTGKTVVYRQGNGQTGARTQIIVSQAEKTSFDTNLAANGLTNARFSAKVRTSDDFVGHKNAAWRDYIETYWGESNSPGAESIVYLDGQDVSKSIYNTGWAATSSGSKVHNRILKSYVAWYPTTLYAKYETGYDPNANHNPTDDSSKDDGTDDIIDPNPQAPEKVDGDTPNPQGFSYFFNGNGQDKGTNYTVRHISSAYEMPENAPFEKQIHSGQGWSVINNATYQSADEPTKCRKKGETVNTLILLNSILGRDDCVLDASNGNITITQFVVWDKFPEINAKDVAIPQAWLDTMTENKIKDKIFETVIGTDKEDGTLPNNKPENVKGVTITDFDMDELKAFRKTGSVTITYRATDGVGNTTDKQVRLWINSKNPIEEAYINRARCINREYYEAGKGYAEGDLTGYKKGGLMPNDRWYTDAKWSQEIEETFENLENENWEYTWCFTHEQVLETQDYIAEHGFGDSEEDGALMNYFNTYKAGFTDYTK